MNREYSHLFKLVVVGNSAVGKTALIMRFSENKYEDNYINTVGVDFRFQTLKINEKAIKL